MEFAFEQGKVVITGSAGGFRSQVTELAIHFASQGVTNNISSQGILTQYGKAYKFKF